MKRFAKVYIEISNICNLKCSFCPGTTRQPKRMNIDELRTVLTKIKDYTDYIYFHLLGEPLCHPDLEAFLSLAEEMNFKVIITTNGTLLNKCKDILLSSNSHYKTVISLHSFEANDENADFNAYLESTFRFCRDAAERGIISVMRLWNIGGENGLNGEIIEKMHAFFDVEGSEWKEIYSGYKICEKVFLEWGQKFDWPDTEAEFCGDSHSCYGLRDQIGILSDGTVVPCCLDAEGAINLGNVFDKSLNDILQSPRAAALKKSFETKKVTEILCQRCGYAKMKGYRG